MGNLSTEKLKKDMKSKFAKDKMRMGNKDMRNILIIRTMQDKIVIILPIRPIKI